MDRKDDFERYLEKQLEQEDFKEAWEGDEAVYAARKAVIDARIAAGMTQADLAAITGMNQRAISRMESGDSNPTVRTLGRIAQGLGKKLRIEFVS